MDLYDITEKDVRKIADSGAILSRGRKYYNGDMIKSMSVADGVIAAKVRGNYGTYNVEISIDEDDDIEADCDCPYDGWGCKHIVAVLYKWIHERNRTQRAILSEYRPKGKEKGRRSGIYAITLNEIFNDTSKESLVKAFDLLKMKKVKIVSMKAAQVTAEVYDAKKEVVVLRSQEDSYGYRPDRECSCGVRHYGRFCAHMAAVMLSVFLNKNKDQKDALSKYEKKIRVEVRDEKYASLVNSLDFIRSEDTGEKEKYEFIFCVEKMSENIFISLNKGLILKNGGIGKPSSASRSILKKYYSTMSRTKKKAVDSLVYAQESSWGSSMNMTIKRSSEKTSDTEILGHLRQLYKESAVCFANCSLPDARAVVDIRIEEIKGDSKTYVLKISANLDGKIFDLSDHNAAIVGKDPLWVYAYDDEFRHPVLFEVMTREPDIVKALARHSLTEIGPKQLKDFVEKYYLKLSCLGEIVLPKGHDVVEKVVEPAARIFLKDYGEMFCFELKFLYGKDEVDYGSNTDIVFRDDDDKLVKIKRNKDEERRFYSVLLENHAVENDGVLVPSIDPYAWLVDVSRNLISLGFEIYGADKLFNVRISPDDAKLRLEVSSGIDWFDLKGDVSFGADKVGFDELMGALNKHERFVKLSDGRMGAIPKKWLNKLSGVTGFLGRSEDGDTARASESQIAIIEALIDIADASKVDQKFGEIREKFRGFREIKEVELPGNINGELRDYQKAGYNWLHFLKEFSFGGCLADEMGLGKTLQVLSLLLYEKEHGIKAPSLVVVPTSLVFNWVNEVRKFTPDLKVHVHHGLGRAKKIDRIVDTKCDLIITTYGTLRNDLEMFKKKKYHYVVLDESQQIKNPLSKIAKSVYSLKSKYRLVLTGTPIENNSLELWSQFAFLNPGLLGNMDYFRSSFSKCIDKDKDEDKMAALKNMIHPFLLLRKKETVAKDLPDKQVTVVYCEMDDRQRKVYDFWKNKFREEIMESIHEKGFNQSRMKILQGLMKLRQICNHPLLVDESYAGDSGKYNVLISQIEEVIREGHKVLIFSSFVKMLKVFRKHFDDEGVRYCYLDGSTRKREEVVDAFQGDNEIPVFLISLKAGGLGLNLTAADYVFIVDPWWNPAAEMQAIDRAHRIGQDKPVFVYKAITKDSVEERILELQQSKLELVKNVVTIEEGIFKKLGREDIKKMFG